MKTDMVILGIASIWSIYYTIKIQNLFSGIITLGLIAGIVLEFGKFIEYPNSGIWVFLIFSGIALLYALFSPKFKPDRRLVLILIVLPVFLYWLFFLNNLQGANYLWIGLFIPFGSVLYGVTKPVNLRTEWGFVIIFLAEALTHIYPKIITFNIF
jgi:hypothetical protein